jgi:hypothetical protein
MLQDEIQAIASSLRAEDREYIRSLPEDRLILLHRSLGRTLRNAFRTNQYPYLFTHCDDQETPETRSFDSLSQTAIKLLWVYLRDSTEA